MGYSESRISENLKKKINAEKKRSPWTQLAGSRLIKRLCSSLRMVSELPCILKEVTWPICVTIHVLYIYTLLTYSLTLRSRVLLKKLTGSQLVKKLPAFYGTRRFITAFTSARHLSLSQASLIQSTPSHPTSWRSILILSSHLRLDLPRDLFPSGFPTKTRYLYPPQYVLNAPPTSFFSNWSPEQHLVSSTDSSYLNL